MGKLNHYLIESLAPLVFRAGKPFSHYASSLDVIFPMPSTAAGLLRAISIGQKKVSFAKTRCELNDPEYQQLLAIQSRGPYLVRYAADGQYELLFAKPSNAVYVKNTEQNSTDQCHEHAPITLLRKLPKRINDEECGSDLPTGLCHVMLEESVRAKPITGVQYWSFNHIQAWLAGESLSYTDVEQYGLQQLPVEIRTHIEIQDETSAIKIGQLFQTASLDLNHQQSETGAWEQHRLGFMLQTELELTDDLVTFGGERRLSNLKPLTQIDLQQKTSPLLQQINQAKGFSLYLMTPAIFKHGYLPAWLDREHLKGQLPNTQLKLHLKAVALEPWVAVSGWDSLLCRPKAMRKAVAAGSIYWFELDGEMDQHSLNLLLQPLADHAQDRSDGFGQTLLTPWQASSVS